MRAAYFILSLAAGLAACAGPVQTEVPKGTVTAFYEEEILNPEKGTLVITSEARKESAEKGTADQGMETLLTPQKYAQVGRFFLSYDMGPANRIVLSIPNLSEESGKQAGPFRGSDLWIFHSAGNTRLTKTGFFHNDPRFSQEGDFIYFASRRGVAVETTEDRKCYLWRIPSLSAGGLTRIGSPAFSCHGPAESPDGTKLLYGERETWEDTPALWYARVNGTLPTRLTEGIDGIWLDNDTVLFSAPDDNTGRAAIWTIRTDGSLLTQIAADTERDCFQPRADPSGRYIAFTKQLPGKPETADIHVLGLRDYLTRQITTNMSRDDMPRWSRDGKYIYFRSSRGLGWNIWRVPADFLERESPAS